jgi:hypothetical protein
MNKDCHAWLLIGHFQPPTPAKKSQIIQKIIEFLKIQHSTFK